MTFLISGVNEIKRGNRPLKRTSAGRKRFVIVVVDAEERRRAAGVTQTGVRTLLTVTLGEFLLCEPQFPTV